MHTCMYTQLRVHVQEDSVRTHACTHSYEYMYRRIVYAHMHVCIATSTCTGG